MRTIIAGSRRIPSLNLLTPEDWDREENITIMLEFLEETITNSKFTISTVLSGHCWGIDKIGETYAQKHNTPLELYPANWQEFGKRAGPLRNQQMALKAEALICLCTEDSKGSMNMLKCMQELKKKYYCVILK